MKTESIKNKLAAMSKYAIITLRRENGEIIKVPGTFSPMTGTVLLCKVCCPVKELPHWSKVFYQCDLVRVDVV